MFPTGLHLRSGHSADMRDSNDPETAWIGLKNFVEYMIGNKKSSLS